ncbi:unnamed protein product [Closterium sp. NIES-54]
MATASLIACSARAASSCLATRSTSGDARRVSPAGRVLANPVPARHWARIFLADARRTVGSNFSAAQRLAVAPVAPVAPATTSVAPISRIASISSHVRRRRFLVPSAAASTGSAAGASDTDGSDSTEGRKEAGNPKAVDPEIVEAGKEGPRPRDADVARGGSADVAGDADMDLEALARELNMDLKEVQEAERMFESAMSAVASLESLSAKFDQMILETAAAESAESEDSRKGLRGVLGEGGLENAGLEGLERGMKELVKEFEAASSRVAREGASQSGEGSEEVDDDGGDVDLAGEAIADMENDLAELQRSVAATLAELDRTATSLTPELGLQEVLKLKGSISADVAQIEQQTGAILGLLREARELQKASQQPGAPAGARQLAAQRAVEARNAMAAMAGSAEAAAETLKALEEEGAADWDGVGGVKGEAIRRAGEEVKRRRGEEEGGGRQEDDDDEVGGRWAGTIIVSLPPASSLPNPPSILPTTPSTLQFPHLPLSSRVATSSFLPPPSQPAAYLPEWHEVAAERAELKKELVEMFSNAFVLSASPLSYLLFSNTPVPLPCPVVSSPLAQSPASRFAYPMARSSSREGGAEEGAGGDVQQLACPITLPCPVLFHPPPSTPTSSQPAYLPQWHEVAAERAELKRELAEMFPNPAYLSQWHGIAEERAELKRELAEMFSNAVQLFQEGDEEGAMALVAANEAEVMGQVREGKGKEGWQGDDWVMDVQQRCAAVSGGGRGGLDGAGGG